MSQTIPAVAAGETFDGTWPFRAYYAEAVARLVGEFVEGD